MSLLTIEDHKVLREVWDAGIRLYGTARKQIVVEKDGKVVKVFKLGRRDDPDEKLMNAYRYYHDRGCVI